MYIFNSVSSMTEFNTCSRFLYQKYHQSDIIKQTPNESYYNPYFIDKDNRIRMFINYGNYNEINSTISFIIKNDGMLFNSKIEINKFIHVGLLASVSFAATFDIMCIAHYIKEMKKMPLCIGVHPRHAKFYQRFFDFKTISEKQDYNGNPMDVLCLYPDIYTKHTKKYLSYKFDYEILDHTFQISSSSS